MDTEPAGIEISETLEIALACDALFDQYDELESTQQADCYENLYPNVA